MTPSMARLPDDGGGQSPGPDEEEEEGEEEYADAVTRHAKYLGIDPEVDAAYMWIAEEVGKQLQYAKRRHRTFAEAVLVQRSFQKNTRFQIYI